MSVIDDLISRIYHEAPIDILFLVVSHVAGCKNLLRTVSRRFRAAVDASVCSVCFLPDFNLHYSMHPASLPLSFRSMPCVTTLDLHSLHNLQSLEGLPWCSLTNLNAHQTGIRSLEPLTRCLRNLQVLWLGSCSEIDSIAHLSECKGLICLDINNTKVQDLSPLSGCKRLRALYCGDTMVQDLSPHLDGCDDLKVMWAIRANLNAEKIEAFKSIHKACRVTWERHLEIDI